MGVFTNKDGSGTVFTGMEIEQMMKGKSAVTNLKDEIMRLRAALKAFADESANIATPYDNHRLAILYRDGSASPINLTVADLRVAASIFNQQ